MHKVFDQHLGIGLNPCDCEIKVGNSSREEDLKRVSLKVEQTGLF